MNLLTVRYSIKVGRERRLRSTGLYRKQFWKAERCFTPKFQMAKNQHPQDIFIGKRFRLLINDKNQQHLWLHLYAKFYLLNQLDKRQILLLASNAHADHTCASFPEGEHTKMNILIFVRNVLNHGYGQGHSYLMNKSYIHHSCQDMTAQQQAAFTTVCWLRINTIPLWIVKEVVVKRSLTPQEERLAATHGMVRKLYSILGRWTNSYFSSKGFVKLTLLLHRGTNLINSINLRDNIKLMLS